jgi:DNA-binding MarR family transcriptional regulator
VAVRTRHDTLVESVDKMYVSLGRDVQQSREEIVKHAIRLTGVDMSYTALLILEQMKDDGTTRMTELAQAVGVTSTTVTRRIQDLEKCGLILRTPDSQDGRASVVNLSKEGRQVADVVGRARFEILRGALEDWSEEDLECLLALFERLRADTQRVWMARYLVSAVVGAETAPPAVSLASDSTSAVTCS